MSHTLMHYSLYSFSFSPPLPLSAYQPVLLPITKSSLCFLFLRSNEYNYGILYFSMQTEIECLRQDNARSSAALLGLREQLTQLEKEKSSNDNVAGLHTEIGRLKTSIKNKVSIITSLTNSLTQAFVKTINNIMSYTIVFKDSLKYLIASIVYRYHCMWILNNALFQFRRSVFRPCKASWWLAMLTLKSYRREFLTWRLWYEHN